MQSIGRHQVKIPHIKVAWHVRKVQRTHVAVGRRFERYMHFEEILL